MKQFQITTRIKDQYETVQITTRINDQYETVPNTHTH